MNRHNAIEGPYINFVAQILQQQVKQCKNHVKCHFCGVDKQSHSAHRTIRNIIFNE